MCPNDVENPTIAAIATPPGEGGIAIVRVSGPLAAKVLKKVFRPTGGGDVPGLQSHLLTHGTVRQGGRSIDEAMAVLMRAPRSYTREDVAEIHCHGGRRQARLVLDAVLQAGARPAAPGEFTRRAFENGRVDLAQAEAVMQLISADSTRAARAAYRQLAGGVSGFIAKVRGDIVGMLAGIEAALDFPDEIDEIEATEGLLARIGKAMDTLGGALDERAAKLTREGLEVVLAGKPNAGKSSLLNALVGEERAIVTPIPGTTRDVLVEQLELGGVRLRLSDTAGIRDSGDDIERLGVARAENALAHADVWVLVIDASEPLLEEDIRLLARETGAHKLVALSKGDLPPKLTPEDILSYAPGAEVLTLSARTGQGLDGLVEALRRLTYMAGGEDAHLTQARHIEAARAALAHLGSARTALAEGEPMDIAAIDLHAALDELGRITGDTLNEDVIDRIFADFCVGK